LTSPLVVAIEALMPSMIFCSAACWFWAVAIWCCRLPMV